MTQFGVLTIPPGEVEAVVEVRVIGDRACEPDEQFTLRLESPTGAALGVATILNDDCGLK